MTQAHCEDMELSFVFFTYQTKWTAPSNKRATHFVTNAKGIGE
jgi:hypothetical protein